MAWSWGVHGIFRLQHPIRQRDRGCGIPSDVATMLQGDDCFFCICPFSAYLLASVVYPTGWHLSITNFTFRAAPGILSLRRAVASVDLVVAADSLPVFSLKHVRMI